MDMDLKRVNTEEVKANADTYLGYYLAFLFLVMGCICGVLGGWLSCYLVIGGG